MPRGIPKPRLEGAESLRTVKESDDLSSIVDGFKVRFPDDWEALRLCPLQHGLDAMIEKLSN